MPTLANLVVGVVVLAVFALMTLGGLGFLVRGLPQAAEAARLVAASPTAAADVTAGAWTMVRGTARPEDDTVPAPISGEEAVCAHSRLEELRSSRRSTVWKPTHETTTTAPFRVADGTGTVRVDPGDPTLLTGNDRTLIRQPDTPDDASGRVREFVAQATDVEGVPAGESVRYRESVVRPGDDVLIYGPVGSPEGHPTFGAGADLTIATESPGAVSRRRARNALVSLLLAGVLFTVPALFVGFFLVPYLLGG